MVPMITAHPPGVSSPSAIAAAPAASLSPAKIAIAGPGRNPHCSNIAPVPAGATAIALGLLTPGGCAVIIGTMIVAAAPNAPKGLWAHLGGCEVPVVYAGLGAVIAFTGPGQYSLDHAIGLTGFGGVGWGLAAVAVGTIAAVPPLLRRRSRG